MDYMKGKLVKKTIILCLLVVGFLHAEEPEIVTTTDDSSSAIIYQGDLERLEKVAWARKTRGGIRRVIRRIKG